jgi:probable rRNA maturation factor
VSARAKHQGDLVSRSTRVREQARRFRVSQGRELARLVVHGALHLAGHDHHRAGERRIMRAAEQRALRASGPAIVRLERALAPVRRG